MDDPRLASSRLHADVERLRAQALLSWPTEARALAALGLADGMSVLEVGSGPGFITQALLDTWPNSTITAVDLDPNMCVVARERADERVTVIEASILQTDVPSNTFDFALARFVLQHVAAPDLAMTEILRLLK